MQARGRIEWNEWPVCESVCVRTCAFICLLAMLIIKKFSFIRECFLFTFLRNIAFELFSKLFFFF